MRPLKASNLLKNEGIDWGSAQQLLKARDKVLSSRAHRFSRYLRIPFETNKSGIVPLQAARTSNESDDSKDDDLGLNDHAVGAPSVQNGYKYQAHTLMNALS